MFRLFEIESSNEKCGAGGKRRGKCNNSTPFLVHSPCCSTLRWHASGPVSEMLRTELTVVHVQNSHPETCLIPGQHPDFWSCFSRWNLEICFFNRAPDDSIRGGLINRWHSENTTQPFSLTVLISISCYSSSHLGAPVSLWMKHVQLGLFRWCCLGWVMKPQAAWGSAGTRW